MTNEDKQKLLIAVCCYLPYGLKVDDGHGVLDLTTESNVSVVISLGMKPYLRKMHSMTADEREDYLKTGSYIPAFGLENMWIPTLETFDWLNKNHIDYRGLIPSGLAIEDTDNIYNI